MDNNSNTFPYFFLGNFPSSSSSSSSPMKILREDQVQHPSPLRLAPAVASKPTKPRKIGKSSSNPNPRNPQRGLGVAQLERIIRLQNPQIQPAPPSNFDFYPTGYPIVNGYGSGSGSGTTMMSPALQQYSLDRVRVSSGSPYLHELPSNQRTPAAFACVSDSCHFCCKKRSFSETLALQECFRLNLAAAIEEEMKVRVERPDTRVYQFFPEMDGRDQEITGDHRMAAASSSSSSPEDDSTAGGFLDLSLKLAG